MNKQLFDIHPAQFSDRIQSLIDLTGIQAIQDFTTLVTVEQQIFLLQNIKMVNGNGIDHTDLLGKVS